jgi:hypothetical protein
VYGSHRDIPTPYHDLVKFVDRQTQASLTSDLRRDATSVVERFVRLFALRVAEAQGPNATAPAARQSAAPRGGVHIIPK